MNDGDVKLLRESWNNGVVAGLAIGFMLGVVFGGIMTLFFPNMVIGG